jgi:hypothetical protein
LNPSSNTLKHNRPQHGRPFASVVAQQYSSAIFVELRSHFQKEKLAARFKNVLFQLCAFLNCVSNYINLKCVGLGVSAIIGIKDGRIKRQR